MTLPGCPYIAGPACEGCDGSCWAIGQTGPPEPEPCQTCSMISGGMQWCEGLCEGVVTEADFEAALVRRLHTNGDHK